MMLLPADGIAAATLFTIAALGLCGAMLHEGWTHARGNRVRTATSILVVLVFVLSVAPAVRTLLPGAPLVTGEAQGKEAHLPLPPSAAGRVLLVVRGKLQENGSGAVLFSVSGTREVVRGTLERIRVHFRMKRGQSHGWRVRSTFHQRGFIPPEAGELKVERHQGELEGPLHIEVYRDEWPDFILLPLASLGLLAAGALHARLQWRRFAPCAGTALASGIFVSGWGEPGAGVEFAVACLFMGLTLGGASGWLIARVWPRGQGRRIR